MEDPSVKAARIAGADAVGGKKKKPPNIISRYLPNVYFPNAGKLNPPASEESEYLLFDLETSEGPKTLSHMIRISARLVYSESSTVSVNFEILVWFEDPLNEFIVRISHHLTKDRVAREGWTFIFRAPLDREVITLFLAWTETEVTNLVTNVGLVSHNGFSCNYHVLATELACAGMDLLERLMYFYIATLSVMKSELCKTSLDIYDAESEDYHIRVKSGGRSLQFESIATYILSQREKFVPPKIDTRPTFAQFCGTAQDDMADVIDLHVVFAYDNPAGFFAHRLWKVWKKWVLWMNYMDTSWRVTSIRSSMNR